MTIRTHIIFGSACLAICDRKCNKAWGVNGRRHDNSSAIELDPNDPDDIVYLADHETGEAPVNPGTYEGGHGKPMYPEVHNKWCVRECERCAIIKDGEEIAFPDFSVRHYNMPSRHPEAPTKTLTRTGEIFRSK